MLSRQSNGGIGRLDSYSDTSFTARPQPGPTVSNLPRARPPLFSVLDSPRPSQPTQSHSLHRRPAEAPLLADLPASEWKTGPSTSSAVNYGARAAQLLSPPSSSLAWSGSIIAQDPQVASGVGRDPSSKAVAADIASASSPSAVPSSTSSLAGSSSLQEAAWSRWVVVYGQASPRQEALLGVFGACGDLQELQEGGGNWVFLRYASPHEAERACELSGSLLGGSQMVAVSRLSAALALRLGVRLDGQGQLLQTGLDEVPATAPDHSRTYSSSSSLLGRGQARDGVAYRRPAASSAASSTASSSSSSSAAADEDIFLPPPRRPSICQQLMRYFFSYQQY